MHVGGYQGGIQVNMSFLHAGSVMTISARHFDTAQMYANEVEVGEAVRESGVKREDLFVSA